MIRGLPSRRACQAASAGGVSDPERVGPPLLALGPTLQEEPFLNSEFLDTASHFWGLVRCPGTHSAINVREMIPSDSPNGSFRCITAHSLAMFLPQIRDSVQQVQLAGRAEPFQG